MLISLMDISLQPPKTSPQGMAHFLILFWQGINATHCFLVGLFCLTSLTQLLYQTVDQIPERLFGRQEADGTGMEILISKILI